MINQKAWARATININTVKHPTEKDYWRLRFNEEVNRQYGIGIEAFNEFDVYQHKSLSECREALRLDYWNKEFIA